jgi:hypothetical protein
MKEILLATIVAVTAAAGPLHARETTTKHQLIGTWKVVHLTAASGGKVTNPLGEQVTGYVTITDRRFWLLFVDGTRKAPASPALTDAESIEQMKTQVAWTGKYTAGPHTPEGVKLTAHVDAASSQALYDTDRVYFIRVNGNKMTVKSPGVIVPMTGQTSVVEFEMVKSD